MSTASTLAACTVLALAASALQPAHAEEYRQNASGLCQAALPAFDGLIRKRPTAIRNEGDVPAFITCSVGAEHSVTHALVELVVTNGSSAPQTVNCTIVTGRVNGTLLYYPVSDTIPAGGLAGLSVSFNPSVDTANLINSSCSLPPGVEINYVHVV